MEWEPYAGKMGRKRVVFFPSLVWQALPTPVLRHTQVSKSEHPADTCYRSFATLDRRGQGRGPTHSPEEKRTETPREPSSPNIWQTFSAKGRGTDCSFSP